MISRTMAIHLVFTVQWQSVTTHLCKKTDLESEGLAVFRARIHVIAKQQNKFENFGKFFATFYFFAGCRPRYYVRLYILHQFFVS